LSNGSDLTVEANTIEAPTGEHVVQFYDDDADLIGTAGRYLINAAQAGEVAIVIATEAHRLAFEAELESARIDLAEARASGRYVSLDAVATMDAFRREGRIDHAAFHEVIGGVVREAACLGRPIRAYGEMVALLWDAGDVVGAIELETLWNDLGREVPFSLFCAYPAASVGGSEHAEALQEVCHLHTSVVAPRIEVTCADGPDPHAPRRVRRQVAGALREAGHESTVVDDVELVVAELTANAVRHAGTPFQVVVRLEGSVLRVEVSDEGSLPLALGGGLIPQPPHGLAIVDALATRWGAERTARGTVVWAELPV
jgi:hypothetical protein